MSVEIKKVVMTDHIIKMGELQLRFEVEEAPEPFVEKARLELRETPEMKEEGLRRLRELMKERGDINLEFFPDIFLLAFLRVCKFYPESAFNRLVASLHFKQKYPKYCHNLSPLKEKNVFSQNVFTVLPYRTEKGERILLIEAGQKWKTKEVSLTEITRGVMMVVEAALLEERTQIAGAQIMIDLEGLSMTHVWQFSPSFAKMTLEYIQETLPCRIKAIHIVNQPYIFNMLFAVFKPFISEKLRNRIYFHGTNRGSLLEHVNAKFLPTQYGGEMNLKTVHGKELNRVMCLYEQQFKELNQRGFTTDGKKGKSK